MDKETREQRISRIVNKILGWFENRSESWLTGCFDTPWDFEEANRLKLAQMIGHNSITPDWNPTKRQRKRAFQNYLFILEERGV